MLYEVITRIYALESSLAGSVYYYQPAIFEAAGVEVPATWEEALDVGAKLHENGSSYNFV